MLTLPDEYNTHFEQFQPHFSKRVWQLAVVLLVGAILAPGTRTVTAILRKRYSLIDRRIENEVVPVAQKFGIAILPYSPLGGGVLTGKYRSGEPFPEGTRAVDDAWGSWATSFLSDKVFTLVDVMGELSGELGCTASQLALAWVLQQPGVTSAIIGPRRLAHLEDNLGALDITLDAEILQRLDQASLPGGALFEARQ